MRTIKFRGYNLKNKEWIYGCYLVNRGLQFIAPDGIQPPEKIWQDFEVVPESIGQYTGMKDVNGVEIYEGDFVKMSQKEPKGEFVTYGIVQFLELFGIITPRGIFSTGVNIEVVDNAYLRTLKTQTSETEKLNQDGK